MITILRRGAPVIAGPKFPFIIGRYYDNAYFCAHDVPTAGAFQPDTLHAIPVILPVGINIDRIAFENTSNAVGAVGRSGIYDDTGNGAPNNLLLDAGEVALETNGLKEVSISESLSAAVYWFVMLFDHTATRGFRRYSYNEGQACLGFENGTDTNKTIMVTRAFSYAALPASFGTPTYEDGEHAVRMLFRVA